VGALGKSKFMSFDKPAENRNIFRLDTNKTHGWQVRFIVNGDHRSKFFNDNKFGGSENALLEARKYRNEKEESIFNERKAFGYNSRKYIYTDFVANNKTGILGVNRTTTKERSGKYSHHWQTAWRDADGNLINRSRAVGKWGEKNALIEIIKIRMDGLQDIVDNIDDPTAIERIFEILEYYELLISYLNQIGANEEELLFKVLSQKKPSKTERIDIINNRIGQYTFRTQVLDYWEQKCCITKSSILLIASHIKPWKVSSASERVDPFNGLALSPNFDKAFDQGYISFSKSGNILIASGFEKELNRIGINHDKKIIKLAPKHHFYLKYHRENVFKHLNN